MTRIKVCFLLSLYSVSMPFMREAVHGYNAVPADRIEEAASVENVEDLYQAQLDIFLDPNDPVVIAQARKDGIPDNWMEGARRSPVYKMAMEWKVAFPLHPEYRTLPMVWYSGRVWRGAAPGKRGLYRYGMVIAHEGRNDE